MVLICYNNNSKKQENKTKANQIITNHNTKPRKSQANKTA
nr:MAG TPA: hypothetical protein [Caudoviricetes sp.]